MNDGRMMKAALGTDSEIVNANTRKYINRLKEGDTWIGRGRHHSPVTVEKLMGSIVWYKNSKGKMSEMTVDYFVHWYKQVYVDGK